MAVLQDYALIGLGAALNGIAALIWPPSAIPAFIGILGGTLGLVEKVDVAPDDLKPDSQFFRLLNASDDPGIPHIIIVGNTGKILEEAAQGNTNQALLRKLANLAFSARPNDLVIGADSMIALPEGRTSNIIRVEIPCDHTAYFNSEVGVRTIVEELLKS